MIKVKDDVFQSVTINRQSSTIATRFVQRHARQNRMSKVRPCWKPVCKIIPLLFLQLTVFFNHAIDFVSPGGDGSCPESYVKQGSLNNAPPENICGKHPSLKESNPSLKPIQTGFFFLGFLGPEGASEAPHL